MKKLRVIYRLKSLLGGTILIVLFVMAICLGQGVPPPVLTIKSLGGNQFSITITNGVTNGAYVLHWTPVLNNPNYPWEPLSLGDVGETNWTVDGSEWTSSFFKIVVGTDQDGDSVPDWQDANPYDPTIGILSVIIDSPLNGTVLQ